jgi:hypothetical protein
VVDAGLATCSRCGLPIAAGSLFHLDHADDGIHYLGVSHASCNMRAGGKLGNARMREKKALEQLQWLERPSRTSREW